MVDTRDPQFLAFWTRTIRETSHWSQEALAANAGLDVRTIQRIEAGKPVNTATRRSLARGLGYEDPDVFDSPAFIEGVQTLFDGVGKAQREEIQKQYPDHMPISVQRAEDGSALANMAYRSTAYLFHADEAIPEDAEKVAASIFDFLRDLGDIVDDLSFSERLELERSLDQLFQELRLMGCSCYIGVRSTKLVGKFWEDKTPLPISIGYLTVVPAQKELTEMMVPRGVS